MTHKGSLYIVSAPSGAGKTSLLKALTEKINSISISISTTTRNIRPGEIDGVDYHFVTVEAFTTMIENNEFIEHAEVFGNFYGTAKSSIHDILLKGQDLVLEIDWQGAQQIRSQLADAISIFILPPSRAELAIRLAGRGQDNESVIQQRMAAAIEELSHYDEYDYLIINDQFEVALDELKSIVKTQGLYQKQQAIRHQQLIAELL